MEDHSHEVSIFVRVYDSKELIKAARQKYVDDQREGREITGVKFRELKREARETITDRYDALRWFFDPGQSPPGVEILDSNCE